MEELFLLSLTSISLTVGMLAGLFSRIPTLGRNLGGYVFILIFAYFAIFFQLPYSFFIPPCLVALPLSQRHPILGKSYLLLLSGSFLFFVFYSFGIFSFWPFLGWSSLLAVFWAILFIGYRNFELRSSTSSLPIGVSFFLLGILATQLKKDLVLVLLCYTLALYLVGLYLGASKKQAVGNHTLRFTAFVYGGIGLLLSDQLRDFLLVIAFAIPFLVLVPSKLLNGVSANQVTTPKYTQNRYIIAVFGQIIFGTLLLSLIDIWEVGGTILLLLFVTIKPWKLKKKKNHDPIETVTL